MFLPSSQFSKLFMNEFPAEWKILGRAGAFLNLAAFKKLMAQTPRWHGPDPLSHSFGNIRWVPRLVRRTGSNREGVWPQSSRGFNGCFDVNKQQDGLRPEGLGMSLSLDLIERSSFSMSAFTSHWQIWLDRLMVSTNCSDSLKTKKQPSSNPLPP